MLRRCSSLLVCATLTACLGPPSPPPLETTTASATIEFVAPSFERPDGGLTIRSFLIRRAVPTGSVLHRCELTLFDDRNRDGVLRPEERVPDYFEILEANDHSPELSGLGWAIPADVANPVVRARVTTDAGVENHKWTVDTPNEGRR